MSAPDPHRIEAPPASKGLAASRTAPPPGEGPPSGPESASAAGKGRFDVDYKVSPRALQAVHARPYQRQPNEALYRALRIYALDPTASRAEGAVATVQVPYEKLEPGPKGSLLEVVDDGRKEEVAFEPAAPPLDLDDAQVLLQQGRTPSVTDPRFRAQMAYAVCSTTYAAFRLALGRDLTWGFDNSQKRSARTASSSSTPEEPRNLLRIRCCVDDMENAYYDRQRGELIFGAFRARDAVEGRNLPRGVVCTALQHDVVVHEMSHALLDGLRASFLEPSGPDVLAFHEAFADLIAIFQRFTYRDVVRVALRSSRGDVRQSHTLTGLGLQFGQSIGLPDSLRRAVLDQNRVYGDRQEAHARGEVLLAAVFEAFSTVYDSKAGRLIRLATGGSGVLVPGEVPSDLLELLIDVVSKLAGHFLSICIRAIDYCPPVDITFGEFLRAMLTADRDLVPDDPWDYRQALIDAFRKYKIYPRDVPSLTEDALVWRAPIDLVDIPCATALRFGELRFNGDPGRPADQGELLRQAKALGRLVSDARYCRAFGVCRADDEELEGDRVDLPVVESIRSSRRVGPDGQVVFDLVAEVIQQRETQVDGTPFYFLGGSTIIFDPDGKARYVIRKSVAHRTRLEEQREFMRSTGEAGYWTKVAGSLAPKAQTFRLLHETRRKLQEPADGNAR